MHTVENKLLRTIGQAPEQIRDQAIQSVIHRTETAAKRAQTSMEFPNLWDLNFLKKLGEQPEKLAQLVKLVENGGEPMVWDIGENGEYLIVESFRNERPGRKFKKQDAQERLAKKTGLGVLDLEQLTRICEKGFKSNRFTAIWVKKDGELTPVVINKNVAPGIHIDLDCEEATLQYTLLI